MMLDVAVLFSGGKDSTRTVEWCLKRYNVKYLLTFIPKNKESYMFHSVALSLTRLSARALKIRHKMFSVSGEKEKEVEEMEKAIKRLKVDGLACGGIASNYQKTRIERVANTLGLTFFAPFWGVDDEIFLRETVALGYEVIITSVSSMGLGRNWLGRRIDEKAINELLDLKQKFGLNIVFEGGEAETAVLDGPIFKKRISILEKEIVWDEKTHSGFLNVLKAKLVKKI